jgi:hypothetical protein
VRAGSAGDMTVIGIIAIVALVVFAVAVPLARAKARGRRPVDQSTTTTGAPPPPPAGSEIEQPRHR